MKNIDLVRLGQEIRRRRLALGWTLEQFAETCVITPNYLGTLENGKRDPHTTTLMSIARALGCSVGDLLWDTQQDLSPAAREVGRRFDQASPAAQEAVEAILRAITKPSKEKDEAGREQEVRRGRVDRGGLS